MGVDPFDLIIDRFRAVVREEVERAERAIRTDLERALKTDAKPAADAAPEVQWMRAEDLARKYNLPATLFKEKGRAGLIERAKPGKHVLFNVRDVERFIRSVGNKNGGSGTV